MNMIVLVFYFGGNVVSSHPIEYALHRDAYDYCQIRGQRVVDAVNNSLATLRYGNASFECEIVTDGEVWSGE